MIVGRERVIRDSSAEQRILMYIALQALLTTFAEKSSGRPFTIFQDCFHANHSIGCRLNVGVDVVSADSVGPRVHQLSD